MYWIFLKKYKLDLLKHLDNYFSTNEIRGELGVVNVLYLLFLVKYLHCFGSRITSVSVLNSIFTFQKNAQWIKCYC